MKNALIMLTIFAAYLCGVATPSAPVAAAPDEKPKHLVVRGLTVVDDDGKEAINLGAGKGYRGVWVQGLKKDTTAGIVADGRTDTPYVMVLDYSGDNLNRGCQVAFSANDGEPQLQLVGKKDVKIFNPLADKPLAAPKLEGVKPPSK